MSDIWPYLLIVGTWLLAFPLAFVVANRTTAFWPIVPILLLGMSGSVIAVSIVP